MASKAAVILQQVAKSYQIYQKPSDRLWRFLPSVQRRIKLFEALKPIDLTICQGDVIGLIGRNGAGKSTLLQLICGTLNPTEGTVCVQGRIAALLELGSGFNPEFTGRENVFMNGAILGLSQQELEARFDEIHAFSEIGDAIEQPVKSYSSGMFVRLAFAVSVCVDPDILVVDEALSVGDGAFAKKSFDRIMQLKQAGKTIIFCSHNLYQIEAICNKALWLHNGKVKSSGMPSEVIHHYENFLYQQGQGTGQTEALASSENSLTFPENSVAQQARLTSVNVTLDQQPASVTALPVGVTGKSELKIIACWQSSPDQPSSDFAISLHAADGRIVASAGTHMDHLSPECDRQGQARAVLTFSALPLLKGEYWLEAYLLCDQGVLFLDQRVPVARFSMESPGREREPGLIHLERHWRFDNSCPHQHR